MELDRIMEQWRDDAWSARAYPAPRTSRARTPGTRQAADRAPTSVRVPSPRFDPSPRPPGARRHTRNREREATSQPAIHVRQDGLRWVCASTAQREATEPPSSVPSQIHSLDMEVAIGCRSGPPRLALAERRARATASRPICFHGEGDIVLRFLI
jgi:hypothetical protein